MSASPRASITPVGARDCALGIAVPLTGEEFLDDLRPSSGKDFAPHVRRMNELEGAADEFYWSSVYAPIAMAVERSCAAVERAGAHVQRRITLADLRPLLEQYKVVTLVAHWKFATVKPVDVVAPRQFLAAIARPSNPLQERIAAALLEQSPALADGIGSASDDALRETIARAIVPVITAAHAAYHRPEAGEEAVAEARPADLRRVTRVLIEEAFPESIRAAPAIELADGMHTVAAFIEAIPRSFDGVLDMTVCNSVILGAAVKRARPDCLVAVNRYPAEMHVRLTYYQLAVVSLATRKALYIDVLTRQRKGS
ncbi:MAG TPA: hypothetical protein VGR02_06165 [Thermoanaerobaculia bacterium]|jgi:hypothetical protein|nr:hypothetical protein [Thermoanaerobaculia bacterium]